MNKCCIQHDQLTIEKFLFIGKRGTIFDFIAEVVMNLLETIEERRK